MSQHTAAQHHARTINEEKSASNHVTQTDLVHVSLTVLSHIHELLYFDSWPLIVMRYEGFPPPLMAISNEEFSSF